MIPEYVDVRIIRIEGDPARRVICFGDDPPVLPAVGQIATIIDPYDAARDQYIVEYGDPDGRPRWIGWFHTDELERV